MSSFLIYHTYHPIRVWIASGHSCLPACKLYIFYLSTSSIYCLLNNKCIFPYLYFIHCNVKTDFKKSKLCIDSWQRQGNMATIVIVCRGQYDQSSSKICITGYNNVFFHFTKKCILACQTFRQLSTICMLSLLEMSTIDNSWKDLIISMGTDYFWYIWINNHCGVQIIETKFGYDSPYVCFKGPNDLLYQIEEDKVENFP